MTSDLATTFIVAFYHAPTDTTWTRRVRALTVHGAYLSATRATVLAWTEVAVQLSDGTQCAAYDAPDAPDAQHTHRKVG